MNKHTIGYELRNKQNLVNRINQKICEINKCTLKLNRLQNGINKDMQDLCKLWCHND